MRKQSVILKLRDILPNPLAHTFKYVPHVRLRGCSNSFLNLNTNKPGFVDWDCTCDAQTHILMLDAFSGTVMTTMKLLLSTKNLPRIGIACSFDLELLSRVHGGFCLWVVPRLFSGLSRTGVEYHTVLFQSLPGWRELQSWLLAPETGRAASCDLFQSDCSLISLFVCSSLLLDFYSACNLTQTS